jgi:mono/diheme cytochrome c family protein
MLRALLKVLCVALLLGWAAGPAHGQADVATFYADNCAPCHTIGEDNSLDLKGVTARKDRAWLVRFMLDPEAVVRSGDPYAARIVEAAGGDIMPAIDGLTPQLAEEILRYIEGETSAAEPATLDVDRPFTREEIEHGRALYQGSRSFEADGPSCVSCHRLAGLGGLGGGTFGPDLTRIHERLRGRRGLDAWLTRPPTPVMRALYGTAPLQDPERLALVALLEDTAVRQAGAPAGSTAAFVGAGAVGALLALVAIGLTWWRRFSAVRRPLVDRARTPHPGDQR